MTHEIKIEEGQRQAILLAIAKLSIERPGWVEMLEEIALLMDNRGADDKAELFQRFRELHARPHPVDRSTTDLDNTIKALAESVKLQSHYASLLNMHDGGERRQFASAREWIDRLFETGTLRGDKPQL